MTAFSDNLRRLRKQAGLTQSELADMIFASPQSISRWESGESEPSVDGIRSLCRAFSVSAEKLIGNGIDMCDYFYGDVADFFAEGDEFGDRALKTMRAVLSGRIKRMLSGIDTGDDSVVPHNCYITDHADFCGVFADSARCNLICMSNTALSDMAVNSDKLAEIFAVLSSPENIRIIMNARLADGWYDTPSATELLGVAKCEFAHTNEMLSKLGMLETKRLTVNGEERDVFAYSFTPAVKNLLLLASSTFDGSISSWVW